jgi:hypothetical protein
MWLVPAVAFGPVVSHVVHGGIGRFIIVLSRIGQVLRVRADGTERDDLGLGEAEVGGTPEVVTRVGTKVENFVVRVVDDETWKESWTLVRSRRNSRIGGWCRGWGPNG